jgi:hypothetical protein
MKDKRQPASQGYVSPFAMTILPSKAAGRADATDAAETAHPAAQSGEPPAAPAPLASTPEFVPTPASTSEFVPTPATIPILAFVPATAPFAGAALPFGAELDPFAAGPAPTAAPPAAYQPPGGYPPPAYQAPGGYPLPAPGSPDTSGWTNAGWVPPIGRPPGSTASRVLIGLGIAVGTLVIVGILAAIAIPVFLNQRQKAARNVVLPATLLSEPQIHNATADASAASALTNLQHGILGLTQAQSAYFGSPSGSPFGVAAAKLARPPTPANESTFFSAAGRGDQYAIPLAPERSGPFGGRMECGELASGGAGGSASICYSLDPAAVVEVLGINISPAQTALLTRQVISSIEVKH